MSSLSRDSPSPSDRVCQPSSRRSSQTPAQGHRNVDIRSIRRDLSFRNNICKTNVSVRSRFFMVTSPSLCLLSIPAIITDATVTEPAPPIPLIVLPRMTCHSPDPVPLSRGSAVSLLFLSPVHNKSSSYQTTQPILKKRYASNKSGFRP